MDARDVPITRRGYLAMRLMMGGVPWYLAVEAVATTCMEHPEWDLTELRSWNEWVKVTG